MKIEREPDCPKKHLPTVLFAPTDFPSNINGRKYNCRAQSTDFENSLVGVRRYSGSDDWKIYPAASADQVDGLPPRWCASLVRLFRLQRRALLRTASGHPLLRWRAICVPPVLWLGLCEPTGNGAAPPLGPSAEDQDEAGREC